MGAYEKVTIAYAAHLLAQQLELRVAKVGDAAIDDLVLVKARHRRCRS